MKKNYFRLKNLTQTLQRTF